LDFKGEQGEGVSQPIRVLLVDGFEPYRKRTAAIFRKQPGFEIVGQAADGREAIQKAADLKPDVIVLEVALPTLNGIEVTREILSISPHSKIVFVTGNDFPQVVREALDAGAMGYVISSDAAGELLAAITSVLLGKQYVSRKLIDRGLSG
jgi:DNA-binding NarL/FixJ family response regulator